MNSGEHRNAQAEPNPFAGQTVVVTGSSRGIGKAIAFEFGLAGANVVIHGGHDQSRATGVSDQLQDLGIATQVIVADISQDSECERLVDAAFSWQGNVDVWINNAGADVLTGPAAQMSYGDKAAQLWQVDVMGTMRLCRLVGPRFVAAQAGVVINMGWDQAAMGQAGESGELFACSKGAVMAFTKSLAKSLAPYVRVNCVAPGWIKTSWGQSVTGYWDERAQGESLLARWGTPEDVAHVTRFLASPAAAFVNGQTISVNGGSQPWPQQLTKKTP